MSNEDQESTVSIYHADAPEGWEINTMMIKSKTKEELDAAINYIRERYKPSIFTISHIAPKDREYLYSVVMYNVPLHDLRPEDDK